jgi:hypothetical protein
VARPESVGDWTLADFEEWNAEVDAKLDPEWVKKYGRQSFEAALTLSGFGPLLSSDIDVDDLDRSARNMAQS